MWGIEFNSNCGYDLYYCYKHCQVKNLLDLWVTWVVYMETYVTYLPDPLTSPASSLFNDFGALNISQRRKVGEVEIYVRLNGIQRWYWGHHLCNGQYSLKLGGIFMDCDIFLAFVCPFPWYIFHIYRIWFVSVHEIEIFLCEGMKSFCFFSLS